jgi:hypothetical protein
METERRFLSGKEIRELLPTLFKLLEEKMCSYERANQ